MLTLAASPASWPTQNTWTNRIHRDDAAAFIAHLINMHIRSQLTQDCYVVTDSFPVSQYEVLQWIAQQRGVEVGKSMPQVLGGKRMSNQRMLATGFSLQYPDYKVGYSAMLDMA